jgi:hypothetical protein
MTIAGGTSEVQRNTVAQRILGCRGTGARPSAGSRTYNPSAAFSASPTRNSPPASLL